jgi:hypothetical protein
MEQQMDDGAFDQNFTWYEWGFVSPAEVPSEDLTVPRAPDWFPPEHDALMHSSWFMTHGSAEGARWPT